MINMKRKYYLGWLCCCALGMSGLVSSCSSSARSMDQSKTLEALSRQDAQHESKGRLRQYSVLHQDSVRGGHLTVKRDWQTGRHFKYLDVPGVRVYTLRDMTSERNGEFELRFIIQIPKRFTNPDWIVTVTPVIDNQGDISTLCPIYITGELYEKYNQHLNASDHRPRQRDARFTEAVQARSVFYYDRDKGMWMTSTSRDTLMAVEQTRQLDKLELTRDGKGEEVWEYHYSQTVPASGYDRDFRVYFRVDAERLGCRHYTFSSVDTIGYRLTSLADFCDPSVKFHPEGFRPTIHEEFTAQVNFRQGQSSLDLEVASNRKSVERLKERIRVLLQRKDMKLQKLSITAACSPEGSVELNARLGQKRAETVQGLIQGAFPELTFESDSKCENWGRFQKQVASSDSIVNREAILEIIRTTDDWDRREALIRSRYPEDYGRMFGSFYPQLREVRVMGYFSRQESSASATRSEVDEHYMQGIDLLIRHRYAEAMEQLAPYGDWNAAVCLLCLGEDAKAKAILEGLPESAKQQYLLAIAACRLHDEDQARSFLERSYRLDESGWLRAHYDIEIDRLTQSTNY